MNKNELIEYIATQADLSKAKAAEALNAMIEGVSTSLVKGKEVTLIGFGTFAVGERAARVGRNPATGEEIAIAASKVVKFRVGKKLKDAVK